MITSHIQARDEIFKFVNEAWVANAAAAVGYIPAIEWQGKTALKIDASKFWARVSAQRVTEEQTNVSVADAALGTRRYTIAGLVFIQIFGPKSAGNAYEGGNSLAEIARSSLRGKATPSKVWFRNVRINELEPEDLYQRFNVVAEFEYDEFA